MSDATRLVTAAALIACVLSLGGAAATAAGSSQPDSLPEEFVSEHLIASRPDRGPPPAPEPLAPRETVSVARGASNADVPLIWSGPRGLVFFVDVERIDADAPEQVVARFTSTSSLLVHLPPARYAWRVYAVDRATQHYAASAWRPFAVAPAEAAGAHATP